MSDYSCNIKSIIQLAGSHSIPNMNRGRSILPQSFRTAKFPNKGHTKRVFIVSLNLPLVESAIDFPNGQYSIIDE